MILANGAVTCHDIKREREPGREVDLFRKTIADIEKGEDFRLKENYVGLDPMNDKTMMSFHVVLIEGEVAAFGGIQARPHFPDGCARLGTRTWIHPDLRKNVMGVGNYENVLKQIDWVNSPVAAARLVPSTGVLFPAYMMAIDYLGLDVGFSTRELKPGSADSIRRQIAALTKWNSLDRRAAALKSFSHELTKARQLIKRSTHLGMNDNGLLYNVCTSSLSADFPCWQLIQPVDVRGREPNEVMDLFSTMPTRLVTDF